MIWLLSRVLRDFPTYEPAARIGLVTAGLLIIFVMGVFFLGPEQVRLPALIGLLALFISAQAIVLWANRGMVTALTAAQRHYLAGDFERAIAVLEEERTRGKADSRALTLLGNAYRQLGRLQESHTVLSEAVDKSPNHHFSLYGFGRTLLFEGEYERAADMFSRALAAGGPAAIRVDLAEAYYRGGALGSAQSALLEIGDGAYEEAHRELLAQYLRHRLLNAAFPSQAVIEQGLPFWQAVAERTAHTPYGRAVAQDVRYLIAEASHE